MTGFGANSAAGTPTGWVVPNLPAIDRPTTSTATACKSGPGGPGDFTLSSITNGNARGNNRAVREEDIGAYVQADFNTDLFGRRMRGNVGVRYVNTDLRAEGFQALGGGTLTVVNRPTTTGCPR